MEQHLKSKHVKVKGYKMSNKTMIEVSQDHIDNGTPNNSKLCALSIAISEKLGTEHSVIQDGNETEIDGENYTQDQELSDWVDVFDNEEDLIPRPCKIEIDFDEHHIYMVECQKPVDLPEWHVSYPVVGSASVIVSARTKEEAIEKVEDGMELYYSESEIDTDGVWAEEL